MNDELLLQIRTIQESMAAAFESCFIESQIDSLRVMIRITIELNAFIESLDFNSPDAFNLTYNIETIFSGIDFFPDVVHAYSGLVGSEKSRIDWKTFSPSSFKEQFTTMFREFIAETNPENKCRLLLDLYKLQIVFAGIFFDG